MKTAFRAAGTNTKLVSIKNCNYVYVIIDEWMTSSYRNINRPINIRTHPSE